MQRKTVNINMTIDELRAFIVLVVNETIQSACQEIQACDPPLVDRDAPLPPLEFPMGF
jgi:hypothetical protein